jgi:hypothetical protein
MRLNLNASDHWTPGWHCNRSGLSNVLSSQPMVPGLLADNQGNVQLAVTYRTVRLASWTVMTPVDDEEPGPDVTA